MKKVREMKKDDPSLKDTEESLLISSLMKSPVVLPGVPGSDMLILYDRWFDTLEKLENDFPELPYFSENGIPGYVMILARDPRTGIVKQSSEQDAWCVVNYIVNYRRYSAVGVQKSLPIQIKV
ncbi:MAG: hypothetical protein JSS82_03630 [Bacteroidetes bacterium]|nr:hypothetical protein [Bacteroidota bacterium]